LGRFKKWGASLELTPIEKEVLDIVLKQDVMGASFLRELHMAQPSLGAKGYGVILKRDTLTEKPSTGLTL
jgi:hypothetical protein